MVTHATIIGRSHRLMQHNCQDFAITHQPTPHIAIGIVCDGCGSKYRANGRSTPSHNEIGANLLGQFVNDYLTEQLSQLPNPPSPDKLEIILTNLHQAALAFLGQLVSHFPQEKRHEFIVTRLLTTLICFIHTPETAVFFWQGDGFLVKDGRICELNSNNQPNYLAYQLLQPEPSPANFQLAFIPQPAKTKWLAVATDGWATDQLRQLNEPRPNHLLQRWLNVQAQPRGYFDDDGAVAVWHQQER